MLTRAIVLALALAATPMAQDTTQELLDAARTGDLETVVALLEAGAEIESADRYGSTALAFAARGGHVEIVRILLARGADPNVVDTFYGMSPVARALMEQHVEVARLLLQNGASDNVQALTAAVQSGDVELARAAVGAAPLPASIKERLITQAEHVAEPVPALIELLRAAETAEASTSTETTFDPATLPDYAGMYRNEQQGRLVEVTAGDGILLVAADGAEARALRPTGGRNFVGVDDPGLMMGFFGRGGAIEFAQLRDGEATLGLNPVDPEEAELLRGGAPAGAERLSAATGADRPAGSLPWSSFRGAGASGNGDGTAVVAEWDLEAGANVLWRTPIPGIANASPIAWGDLVFVTTAISSAGDETVRTGLYGDVAPVDDLSAHEFKLYAIDRRSGELRWDRVVHEGPPQVKRHTKSSQANSTPVTDGERVVVLFGTVGVLAAYDFAGEELWRHDIGVLDSGWFYDADFQWGHSASPVIYDDLVIVQADIQRTPFIAAYELATGREVWRTTREEIPTFATPTVYRGEPRDELITNGTRIRAYDPRTGAELWSLAPNSEVIVGTPVAGPDLVYITAGYPPVRPIYAVRPGGSGDISLPEGLESNENIVWSKNRGGTYIPSPLLYRGILYTNANNGRLTAYDAATGQMLYRARIGGTGGSYVASPVAADGHLYFSSEDGVVTVVKAGPEYEEVSSNAMNDVIWATPAVTDGVLVVRTLRHVYGLGSE